MSRSCEEDPAFDYILTLFLEATAQPLTVLPTHRIVRGLGDDGRRAAAGRPRRAVRGPAGRRRGRARARFEAVGAGAGRRGRFGLWTRDRRRAADRAPRRVRAVPAGRAAPPSAALDVTLLGVALERLAGIDADAVAAGAVGYTKSAAEAIDRVDAGLDGADAAFLLEPTPVAVDLGRRRRRRRHAPEVDLFLSQGPDRPRHQPARMVNLHARHDA